VVGMSDQPHISLTARLENVAVERREDAIHVTASLGFYPVLHMTMAHESARDFAHKILNAVNDAEAVANGIIERSKS
jgi:hypothetical protein